MDLIIMILQKIVGLPFLMRLVVGIGMILIIGIVIILNSDEGNLNG